LAATVETYESFVAQSERDLLDEEAELATLTQTLLKEQAVQKALEMEKRLNQEELDKLGQDYKT
jgi:hypothetical protein